MFNKQFIVTLFWVVAICGVFAVGFLAPRDRYWWSSTPWHVAHLGDK